MNIEDLYNKLDKIFIEHTTHNWKNGWQHEGDRKSKKLSIQNNIPWNNSFLLTKNSTDIELRGPNDFKIEINKENTNLIRIDIEAKEMSDKDIYYYVDNQLDWECQQDFIIELCQKVYDATLILRESCSMIPGNMYGIKNPDFAKMYRRDKVLSELINE